MALPEVAGSIWESAAFRGKGDRYLLPDETYFESIDDRLADNVRGRLLRQN